MKTAALRSGISTTVTGVLILPIIIYRRWISPFTQPRCRYYPTCSTYAQEALQQFGPIKGAVLAVWRLVRCNPWSPGGVDPVANQKVFHVKHHTGNCCEAHR